MRFLLFLLSFLASILCQESGLTLKDEGCSSEGVKPFLQVINFS